jgi:uncharacterized phage infection (PIP) family protein YhgE
MENSDQTPKNPEAGTEGTEGTQGTEQPGQELLDELTQLADKFATVVRSAWNSEQRKQVEADVRAGLSTMAVSIEDGLKQVASSNEAKDLQTKATEVGEKVTSTKFFAELTGALTTGLRTLSDQLDKVSEDLQAKNAATGAMPPPPAAEDVKDIPISKE